MQNLWKINESRSSETWLELADALDPNDTGETWSAIAKWDSCVHLYRHVNGDAEPDYIHFCGPQEIRRWIARLEELLTVAKQYHRDHGNAECGWFDDETTQP